MMQANGVVHKLVDNNVVETWPDFLTCLLELQQQFHRTHIK